MKTQCADCSAVYPNGDFVPCLTCGSGRMRGASVEAERITSGERRSHGLMIIIIGLLSAIIAGGLLVAYQIREGGKQAEQRALDEQYQAVFVQFVNAHRQEINTALRSNDPGEIAWANENQKYLDGIRDLSTREKQDRIIEELRSRSRQRDGLVNRQKPS